ncbi:App1 family protein [Yoonia sp. 2307UL14-13]|uniref:App1 family protein n=1 Tax=Yoonia sp. 2307UL14-13 TaxID=3126506 RepID=UPI0030B25B1C
MKLFLARIAVRIERLFGFGCRPREAGAIVPYVGYATPEHLIVRGRVLARVRRRETRADQGMWRNFRQMIGLFRTAEVGGVTVKAQGVSAVADEEGYFTLLLPRGDAHGWCDIPVSVGAVTLACPVMIPDPRAAFGVISDIDDTMMHTGAYSLWRNLWTSLTGNAQTRIVFSDAVRLMRALSDGGRNPVHFVSSSPWNFHGFLTEVFDRHDLPRGPMFLRDYGISETQFITGTHGDHKGSAIDVILGAEPDWPFILIGDTGQHDAQVYLAAVERHPGRIGRVILRAPGKGADAEDLAYVEKIRALGVPVHVGADYTQALEALAPVAE